MATDFTEHEWDPDQALSSLTDESTTLDDGDTTLTAERLFRQALPGATASLIQIALYSTNESNRLKAAQIVVDRNLGTVQSVDPLGTKKDALQTLLEDIYAAADNRS